MKLDDIDHISDDELAELYIGLSSPKPETSQPETVEVWNPSLSAKQQVVFDDVTTPNLLLVSSRYTGKSYACGYVAARHAYDFHGSMVLVVAKTKRQLMAGGLFEVLGSDILPTFKQNIDGFDYVGPKTTVEKDVIFQITNRFGTKSVIQMMSVASDSELKRKIRGITASLLIIDEITLYDTIDIFEQLSGVLGRRTSIPSENQRMIATCNPTSPEHWVATTWSVLEPEEREEGYGVIQFFPADNPSPHVADYYARLRRTLANNPTQLARDVEGEWVAVPSGNAIFKNHFNDYHVKGDVRAGTVLQPRAGLPICVGYDLGDTNHGVSFLQEIITPDKIIWIVFDEVSFVSKEVSLDTLTHEVLSKMNYWCEEVGHQFSFSHISDKSAFDRFRSANGSFDNKVVEQCSRDRLKDFPQLTRPIRMIPCPKPEGSVAARTRLIMNMLSQGGLFVSANCVQHIEMFRKIVSKKEDPFSPGVRSRYKHIYDSLGYPIFYNKCGGVVVVSDPAPEMRPQIMQVGA